MLRIYVWALLCARLPGWKVCVLRWRGVCLSVMRVRAGTYLAVSLRNPGGDARHACA